MLRFDFFSLRREWPPGEGNVRAEACGNVGLVFGMSARVKDLVQAQSLSACSAVGAARGQGSGRFLMRWLRLAWVRLGGIGSHWLYGLEVRVLRSRFFPGDLCVMEVLRSRTFRSIGVSSLPFITALIWFSHVLSHGVGQGFIVYRRL